MQPLLHSPLLQALGYAIINSLWQFALLWLLYFALNTVLKLSTHQKYITGVVLEFGGFIWFIETFLFYYKQLLFFAENAVVNHQVYFPGFSNLGASGSGKQEFYFLILRFEQFFPYLSAAYLFLLAILVLRWVYALIYTNRVRTKGLKTIAGGWQLFVERLSLELGIERKVNIFLSELVKSPLTIGFFKPIILVPTAAITYLTPEQLEAVLIHELAHIKRFDYLSNLVLALIEATLFFNPFMKLINGQIKKERENSCDDWVIKYDYNAASYAHALLQIASQQIQSPLLALHATGNKRLLINRVKRIIERNESSFFNYRYQVLALLLITTILSSLSFFAPTSKIRQVRPIVQSGGVFEDVAVKVHNPLFTPVFFLPNTSKPAKEESKKLQETKTAGRGIKTQLLTPPPTPAAPRVPEDEERMTLQSETQKEVCSTYPSTVTIAPIIIATETVSPTDIKLEDGRMYIARNMNAESLQARTANRRAVDVHSKFAAETTKERKAMLENVRIELNKALNQIKAVKSQKRLNKIQMVLSVEMTKIQQRHLAALSEVQLYKEKELDELQNQIEAAIDSINVPKFVSVNFSSDVNFNFEFPKIIYNLPGSEKHSYSFEYSTSPTFRIINPPPPKKSLRLKKNMKCEASINPIDEKIEAEGVQAPKPAAVCKPRALYVIKI